MTIQQVSIRTLPNLYPDTQDVYSVTVNGAPINTVVTKDAATVDHWIEQIYSDYKETLEDCAKKDSTKRFLVALDVEWKPAAFASKYDYPPVAILKLCVGGDRCLIFQILRSFQFPKSLHRFLDDDNLRFVGVGIEDVAFRLENEFNLCVKRAVDLRDLVAEKYPRMEDEFIQILDLMELAKVVFRFREIERPKDVSLSNWNQKYLTREQIMYAVVDPYVSSRIGDQLGYVCGPYDGSVTILD
ncbi:Werner Syndrome-like exonuclease [Papaver somniferum]|uniref:Werner Syndrome-like exonuclease n=1 Tax=Papaver somniferum TaxID=3469 RepID=UPI000E6FABA5|nr:Werner Syndrome-like exonuclease [Papaver somniferum]